MTDSLKNLYRVRRKDISKVSRVLAEAFQDDPVWTHIIPDEDLRREKLPIVFAFITRYSLHYGEIYSPTEAIEGVAIWIPDKYVEQTFWRVLRSGAVFSASKIGNNLGKELSRTLDPLDADRKENIKPPYMYLQAIGVSPKFQGQGFGSKLLRSMFQRLDINEIPIYLETETEKNAAMYKKLGFQVVKEGTLHNFEFYIWEMIRKT